MNACLDTGGVDEEGLDQGGVKKEFFQLLTREIFNEVNITSCLPESSCHMPPVFHHSGTALPEADGHPASPSESSRCHGCRDVRYFCAPCRGVCYVPFQRRDADILLQLSIDGGGQ